MLSCVVCSFCEVSCRCGNGLFCDERTRKREGRKRGSGNQGTTKADTHPSVVHLTRLSLVVPRHPSPRKPLPSLTRKRRLLRRENCRLFSKKKLLGFVEDTASARLGGRDVWQQGGLGFSLFVKRRGEGGGGGRVGKGWWGVIKVLGSGGRPKKLRWAWRGGGGRKDGEYGMGGGNAQCM